MNTKLHRFGRTLAVFTACSVPPIFAQSYRVDFGANNVFPVPSPTYEFGCPFCPQGAWNAVDASTPSAASLFDRPPIPTCR